MPAMNWGTELTAPADRTPLSLVMCRKSQSPYEFLGPAHRSRVLGSIRPLDEPSHANIRAAAQRAVERFGEEGTNRFSVYLPPAPIALSVTFSSTAEALMGSLVPGSVRENPRTVTYTANNPVDAWKGFFAVLLLGWSATDDVYG
jgi:hypothetical protein